MKDVPGVDAESVRTVVSRTENQPLHDPQSPLGRIDLEALAAAEPVVGVKAGRLDDANLAPHLTLLSSTERPLLSRGVGARSWSTPGNDYFPLWHSQRTQALTHKASDNRGRVREVPKGGRDEGRGRRPHHR